MKLMFMKYAEKMRGGRVDFTPEELQSAMTGEIYLGESSLSTTILSQVSCQEYQRCVSYHFMAASTAEQSVVSASLTPNLFTWLIFLSWDGQ